MNKKEMRERAGHIFLICDKENKKKVKRVSAIAREWEREREWARERERERDYRISGNVCTHLQNIFLWEFCNCHCTALTDKE